MWDIKSFKRDKRWQIEKCIIWTMWDIKRKIKTLEFGGKKSIIWTMWDIKKPGQAFWQLLFCRIIWTMWDIKFGKVVDPKKEITIRIIWTMWDIKLCVYAYCGYNCFIWSIIWTMWDIKVKDLYLTENLHWYYLNHVGYKAGKVIPRPFRSNSYYLNHVGYKEEINHSDLLAV